MIVAVLEVAVWILAAILVLVTAIAVIRALRPRGYDGPEYRLPPTWRPPREY